MRLTTVFVFVAHLALAQFTYVFNQQVPVVVDQDTLTMPWAGGLNAAQFNTMDLDFDGKEDLVLFDRMANRVITFLNVDDQYIHAPEYESFFPVDTEGFMILRDFDCDGRKDLFTKDIQGVKVFRNISEPEQPLRWEQFFFYTGSPTGGKSHVLLTKGFSGKINLQMQTDDLPAILDVDGDGDLDIVSLQYPGGSRIEYHKNFSMERYGTCDSLDFERMTQYWGGVEECDCGVFAFGEPCTTGGRQKHAGGKSLLVLDVDNDGDLDVLFSEAECTQVYQLTNEGTNENPLFTSASQFPTNNPINILPFPSVYFEDVDFDGKKDLLASPNIFAREFLQTNLRQSTWFYKNTGTSELPQFSFQQRDFLQSNMIDVGDNAVPAFFDADADGDLDMFIGTFTNGNRASIFYYENIGTRTEPVFKFFTDDVIGLSFNNFTNIKPQFADVNGDAKVDLVFLASNQFRQNTNLYYVTNTSSAGLNFSGQQVQSLNFPIPWYAENVLLTDINNDLLPDLLIGKLNGSLEYWQNTGTPTSPNFTLTDTEYLGLGSSILRQNLSIAVADLNADGKPDLVLGDQTGRLTIIDDFKNKTEPSGTTNIIYNPLTEEYSNQNLGGRVWPAIANIFNTTKPSIVVGNTLGGIQILQHDESQFLPESPQITVYPNPAIRENSSVINISVDRPGFVYLVSITGQQLGSPILLQGQQLYQFRVDGLSAGIYVLHFIINGKSYARRIILQ